MVLQRREGTPPPHQGQGPELGAVCFSPLAPVHKGLHRVSDCEEECVRVVRGPPLARNNVHIKNALISLFWHEVSYRILVGRGMLVVIGLVVRLFPCFPSNQ